MDKTLTIQARAWLDGMKAFQGGASRSANPYVREEKFTTESALVLAKQWFEGYDDANMVADPKNFGKVVA
jgi:hypothetical protein